MAKKEAETPSTTRVQALVDTEVANRMHDVRAALRRESVHVSVSHFVEIALREILKRPDIAQVMRKYKATARRD